MADDQTITTIAQRPPNEQAAFDQLLGAGTGGPPIGGQRGFFPGQTVAGFTPDQIAAQDALRQTVSPTGQVGQQVSGALTAQTQAQDLGQLLADPLSISGVRDFREQTIQDASRQLGELLLPQINQGSVISGGFGGAKNQIGNALAAARVQDATLKNLGAFDANLFGQLLSANTAALDRAPTIAGLGLVPGTTQDQIGSEIQRQNQAELLGERERFEFGQNEPFFTQDNLRATLGLGLINQNQEQQTAAPGIGEILFGGGLAGLGAILGAGNRNNQIPGIGGAVP